MSRARPAVMIALPKKRFGRRGMIGQIRPECNQCVWRDMRHFRRDEVTFACAADQRSMFVSQAPLATAGQHRGPAPRRTVAAQDLAPLRQHRAGFDSVVLVAAWKRRIATCRAVVVWSLVWSCDGRTDGGGADTHAHATAHIGTAMSTAPIGTAGPNTARVDTTGANAACMDSSGTAAASNGEGLGRRARDPDDCCRQAGHDDSV